MFLDLAHKRLDAYKCALELLSASKRITSGFPDSEKFGLQSQINRSAISILLNIAEGASRFSVSERRRYFEIARGSVVELDAAFEASCIMGYLDKKDTLELGVLVKREFQMLSSLVKSQGR